MNYSKNTRLPFVPRWISGSPAACLTFVVLGISLGFVAGTPTANAQPTTPPRITAIGVAGTDLVIEADSPGGITRLVLEGAEKGEVRAWRPRAVQRVSQPGSVTFRLPWNLAASLNVEMFRVRADTNDPLPAAFYTGKTEFAGEPAPGGNPMLYRGVDGSQWVVDTAAPGAPVPEATPQRNVVESDIWRLQGDRLYFFNHQRGLQIVDVANPDAPTLLATFPLPASGEQMYLMGDHHVVLLARSQPCDSYWGQDTSSAVIVIDVAGDAPRETARVSLQGRILESRLVGTALYVATDTWNPKSDQPGDEGVWINGTQLSGIDLANPAQPVARDPVWLPGSGNVVTATERFLLVGIQDNQNRRWWESRLHVLDIQDPTGEIAPFAEIDLGGRLQDKFKVDISGDILTAITAGPSNADGSGVWRSALTTYRLAHPAAAGALAVTRLGSVEVGHGEQLYATRFDGQRAYLVTFRQIDPLWIVDLSQPESPRVLGELEIPGWSTYIQPLGDRLLTVGFDTTGGVRAAIQLFDVSNPAKPTLLSKVPLGKEWSWSEANTDEKALGVFPQAGLVLVPFSSSSADQQVAGVQVIDLERDTLTARGRIVSPNVVPRRTTLAADRVLAVSARDLVSVNLANRDQPEVRGRLELSYPVDRVIPVGDWLVEFSEGHLRTKAANAPSESRARLDLGDMTVLGAARRDSRILVLQGRSAETVWKNDQWITNSPAQVKLSILDATTLPDLTIIGSVSQDTDFSAYGDFEAHWPLPNLVVWSPVVSFQPWYYRGGPLPIELDGVIRVAPGSPSITLGPGVETVTSIDSLAPPQDVTEDFAVSRGVAIMPFWPWWNVTPPTLLAFDVSAPDQPRFASAVRGSDTSFGTSRAETAEGLVYFGHDTQEVRISGTNTYVNVISQPVTTTRDVLVTNVVKVPYEALVTNVYAKEFTVPASQLSKPIFASTAAGAIHALGLDPAGKVFGWGDNRSGQLGSTVILNAQSPIELAFPAPATSVAGALWFTLARLADGSVWIAGDPYGPEAPPLPDSEGNPAGNQPVRPVPGLPADVAEVAAGFHQGYARTAGGRLFAWGTNDRGQLGTGDRVDHATPVEVGLPSPISQVAGGGLHALAITSDGEVLAWGDNRQFQVGLGSPAETLTAQPVAGLPPEIQTVAAGDFHSVALDRNQSVWTWGAGLDGEAPPDAVPRLVHGLPPIRAIAAGRYHSVAVDLDGQVWSWGLHASEPYRIQRIEPIESVSARGSYAVANGISGQTYVWELDKYPTPFAGTKLAFPLISTVRTNVEPGLLYREEIQIVTKTIRETHWVETTVTNEYPVYEYLTHHHLNVVDYNADATRPVVRPPVAIPGSFQGLSHQGALVYTVATRTEAEVSRSILEASAYDGTAVHLVTGLEIANFSKGDSALAEVTPGGSVWLAQSTEGGKSHQLSRVTVNDSGRFEKGAGTPLASYVQDLDHIGETLSVSFGSTVQLFEATPPIGISALGLPFDLGCLLPGLHRLAGDADSGFWAPLGDFGSAPVAPTF
ncbi:MAG: beta-propeller domain-containing protein [Limisphaerales bacterium]